VVVVGVRINRLEVAEVKGKMASFLARIAQGKQGKPFGHSPLGKKKPSDGGFARAPEGKSNSSDWPSCSAQFLLAQKPTSVRRP
jgi:hypothetical protein